MAKKIEVATIEVAQVTVLPKDGVSRFAQLSPFIGLSREKWRQLVRDGKAPAPIRLGTRCTVYQNAAVHAWLVDPVNYRAEEAV